MTGLLTGDRSLLGGRIGSLLPNVWSLRLTDPTDHGGRVVAPAGPDPYAGRSGHPGG